jgi:phage-related minor tail protein
MVGSFNTSEEDLRRTRQLWEEVNQAIKEVDKTTQQTGRTTKGSLESNLGSALVDIVIKAKSAKDAFKDMGDAIVQDINRISARMTAAQTVQLMLGGMGPLFGEGGIVSGHFEPIKQFAQGGVLPGQFMPITPMQHGGVYSRPTLGLIAEAGTPEAVIPLKRGGVPVEFKDKPRAERPTYIVNAFSEEFMQQQINRALASNAEVIVNMVQQDIMAGGSTYQLIRGLR